MQMTYHYDQPTATSSINLTENEGYRLDSTSLTF